MMDHGDRDGKVLIRNMHYRGIDKSRKPWDVKRERGTQREREKERNTKREREGELEHE